MTKNNLSLNKDLFIEIKELIEENRRQVAQAINAGLTTTYWHIGKLIREDILQNSRAGYGQNILQALPAKLVNEYGSGFLKRNLANMVRFAETFPDFQIVSTLWRQLSWSHFKEIIYLKTDLEREFYAQMCRIEKWSVRTLRKKIDSMLFEHTTISKKPEDLAKLELKQLKEEDKLSPDLVFRDHYVLDFLNLKDTYSEKDLNIVTIVRNEFNKIKKAHPEVIERVKELPNRTKTAKLFSENNTVVFRKKGMALFSLVGNY